MVYSDLKLEFCPFCGSKTTEPLYCHKCHRSFQILTEYGKIAPDIIDMIKWSPEVTEFQKEIILELASEMVKIPGGSFTMGDKDIEKDIKIYKGHYTPHRVTLSPFYISKFLVTQRQWFAFMPQHNCENIGDELPVDSVSWLDINKFTDKLEELSNIPFSMPTEAQWLYVAKECNNFYNLPFSGSGILDEVAWTKDNTDCSMRPGLKKPNALGIYDLCGNISEQCLDRWTKWTKNAITDPYHPLNGGGNMVRKGGSYYYDNYDEIKPAYNINSRDCRAETARMVDTGFRLAIFDKNILNEN